MINQVRARVIFGSLAIALLVSLLWVTPSVAAPQALPPRPTPKPLDTPPEGGIIKLVTSSAVDQEMWTVIQWKDGFGVWHDVDGWRGSFYAAGMVVWYVGPENLNTGPFRWLVFESQDGGLLATSEDFDLPAFGGQMVTVEISLH